MWTGLVRIDRAWLECGGHGQNVVGVVRVCVGHDQNGVGVARMGWTCLVCCGCGRRGGGEHGQTILGVVRISWVWSDSSAWAWRDSFI